MPKRHHTSYKLKEDSLDVLARELNAAGIVRVRAARKVDDLQKELDVATTALEEAQAQFDTILQRLKYLMAAKHKTSIVVDRVRFVILPDGTLERQLVLV